MPQRNHIERQFWRRALSLLSLKPWLFVTLESDRNSCTHEEYAQIVLDQLFCLHFAKNREFGICAKKTKTDTLTKLQIFAEPNKNYDHGNSFCSMGR